jgi:hypothetical protein
VTRHRLTFGLINNHPAISWLTSSMLLTAQAHSPQHGNGKLPSFPPSCGPSSTIKKGERKKGRGRKEKGARKKEETGNGERKSSTFL